MRDEHLSGNPLDSDKPVRRKGKSGIPRKPKRISKTKENILRFRDNVLKAKELVKNVVIERECIRYDSKLEDEDLLSALSLVKLTEMKKNLKHLDEEFEHTSTKGTDQDGEREIIDNSSAGINVTDFRKVVESCSVPAHLLMVHNHNFKR